MPFKYSPLIHVCECKDDIAEDCHSMYYVKEITKRQIGVNGKFESFAQLYAKNSDGSEHYHGPYAVDLAGVKGDGIKEAEKQIQQLPEFKGELRYDAVDFDDNE